MPVDPPFVNKTILDIRDSLNNCLVRVVCEVLTYDEYTAIVETTDGEPLNVIFLKKVPYDFKFIADYYLLKGIAKENGSYLLVEEEPVPLYYPGSLTGTRAEIVKMFDDKKLKTIWSVLNEMTNYIHDRKWLRSSGTIHPDPRFIPIFKSGESELAPLAEEEEEETAPNEDGTSGLDEEMQPPAS
ncbi:hypothetical protein NP233_g8183 [Leucocoprinus birnbaumii]|uniref:Uncharacterized protein n=1 Tax=Leucocoprinus birnbaumii TaxID=56174 RepID=A0AAD5YND4_9AGAR|nr:hypothetical protein NP233_g8183 [Leucocoprinus birnbaumii]